ncbi:type II toxin-antitoxin system VapC family toxin [Mucilaginibacter celer]|uniref:Ribonuclease VapC n=1 Tax=Mucilaginibacter celer TaxID=2305508 RepID=A0A494W4Y9_9SPHI|nr:type II toxin-antitoxin system VapC family toxin [Mucilaginibacter celer]AYL98372.1 PIN domain-containing protein [Mucilaginibacter celer]
MSGKEILADTNIILYLLNGDNAVEKILQGKRIYVSFITELELLGFKGLSEKEEKKIKNLLDDCTVISMSNSLKDKYVDVKKKHALKLPDAIIAATAILYNLPFITSDKQFRTIDKLKLIVYEV